MIENDFFEGGKEQGGGKLRCRNYFVVVLIKGTERERVLHTNKIRIRIRSS